MNHPQHTADEQARLWNGPAGRAWVEAQDILDQMLQPFEDVLIEAASALHPARVLDVGCGTGGTTLALARTRQDQTRQRTCLGLDISAPMIAKAQARALEQGANAHFICADAQRHVFEPGGFDLIVSRFGVMFFDDPVQAFSNLRHAAADGAHLRFVAWRGAAENPFMTAAERAAAPLLQGELPARRSDGPGQFAFADRQRILAILEGSGWADIDVQPLDVTCVLPEAELDRYLSWLGPVGVVLQQMDEPRRREVVRQLRVAFEPYVQGETVRLHAACWTVGARAAASLAYA